MAASVPIDAVDASFGTEQVGEGEGERSVTRPQLRPDHAAVTDAFSEQPDMVAVVHVDATSVLATGPMPCQRCRAVPQLEDPVAGGVLETRSSW